MARHGYLREYDEDFGRSDDRDREWRGQGRGWSDRDRGQRDFMLGNRDRGRDQGFFERVSDRARNTFDDLDRDFRTRSRAFRDNGDWRSEGLGESRERGLGRSGGDFYAGRERSAFAGDFDEGGRGFSSHPDDHYRSWRDRQVQALDRDYADYCREREQQFHRDFDDWRRNRLGSELRAQQGSGPDEQTFTPETTAVGNTMTTSETHEPQSTTEPEEPATLGTTLGRRR